MAEQPDELGLEKAGAFPIRLSGVLGRIELCRTKWELMPMENIPYDISCSKAIFDVVKRDEHFLDLITLARIVNALRFCQKAGIDGKESTGYAGARSTINSFVFAASVLYEGFLLVARLGRNFRDLDSFKNGFGVLLRDNKVKTLRKRDGVVSRMRNKFAFHFDDEVAKESLENFELSEYKFASGIGEAAGEMVFVLADEVVINYLLQPTPNDTDDILRERYKQILDDTTEVMGKFHEAAERLMGDVLKDMGFKVKSQR